MSETMNNFFNQANASDTLSESSHQPFVVQRGGGAVHDYDDIATDSSDAVFVDGYGEGYRGGYETDDSELMTDVQGFKDRIDELVAQRGAVEDANTTSMSDVYPTRGGMETMDGSYYKNESTLSNNAFSWNQWINEAYRKLIETKPTLPVSNKHLVSQYYASKFLMDLDKILRADTTEDANTTATTKLNEYQKKIQDADESKVSWIQQNPLPNINALKQSLTHPVALNPLIEQGIESLIIQLEQFVRNVDMKMYDQTASVLPSNYKEALGLKDSARQHKQYLDNINLKFRSTIDFPFSNEVDKLKSLYDDLISMAEMQKEYTEDRDTKGLIQNRIETLGELKNNVETIMGTSKEEQSKGMANLMNLSNLKRYGVGSDYKATPSMRGGGGGEASYAKDMATFQQKLLSNEQTFHQKFKKAVQGYKSIFNEMKRMK